MIVLLSPTKKQKITPSHYKTHDSVIFNAQTGALLKILKSLTRSDLKTIMKLSDKLAENTYHAYQDFASCYPAIFCYDGLVFKSMKPESWSSDILAAADEHLLILSAFYGLLRPFDLIGHYRLDFMHPFPIDLYGYWSSGVSDYLNQQQQPLIDLASKEYSKMIQWDKLTVPYIKVEFKENIRGNYITKSTPSKIMRGKMTAHIIQQDLQSFEDLKTLDIEGYSFNDVLSDASTYVFAK